MANTAVRIGKDAAIKMFAQVQVHVKIGICINFMPGARILNTVTKKLTAVSSVPSPDICNAHI